MHSPDVPDAAALARELPAALVAVRAGRITDGMATLTALVGNPGLADPIAAGLVASSLVECRLARGELTEAVEAGDLLDPLLALAGPPGALAHHALGELATALGEPEQAVDHLLVAGERLGSEEMADPALVPWRASAAVAMVRVGRRREAVELADQWHDVAVAAASPYALAHALRTLAVVGGGGDRLLLLREAKAALTGVTADRLAAQIDTDLAGLLLLDAAGEPVLEALTLLRSAEEYAGRQELWPLQGRVRRLLERMGEPPRRVQSEAMAALTVAERRVARLAADGMTNRQIAEELVVTVKAVEWHLSHIYRKLGIPSRGRLAATLGAGV